MGPKELEEFLKKKTGTGMTSHGAGLEGLKGLLKGLSKCLVIFQILDMIRYASNPDAYMREQPICQANPLHPACPEYRKLPAINGYIPAGHYLPTFGSEGGYVYLGDKS